MTQYRAEGEAALCRKGSERPRKQPFNQEAYYHKLEMENELLRKYHTELRKLTRYRVIEHFGISRAACYAWRTLSCRPDKNVQRKKLIVEA